MTSAQPTPSSGLGRYSTGAIVLHWLIAAAIIFQVSLGWRMEDLHGPAKFAVFQLHKSVGITILLLTVLRIVWRLMHRPAPMPSTLAPWERLLAKAVHVGFYVALLGAPLTGWAAVSTSKTAIPTLLYGLIPWPAMPGLAQLSGAARHSAHEAGELGHSVFIWLAIGLFALHVAGALKHQLFGDEPVLSRMAPGSKPGRRLEPWLLVIALGVVAALAAGKLVQPPAPTSAPTATPAAVGPSAAAVAPPPAAATPTVAATPTPVASAPVAWAVDRGSALSFATVWSGTPINGRFERWNADIAFSPQALDRSHVTVAIDLTSVDTGDGQRDASLKGEDWFDAASHKTATFKATRFTHQGGDRYLAAGTLTLRGVAKPVSLPFRLQISGDKASVAGVTSLDRTVFGVGQGEWTSTNDIPAKVSLTVDLKAHRK